MTWTDWDDVVVGLHGIVTVLGPCADDAEDPDTGGPTLDTTVGVDVLA